MYWILNLRSKGPLGRRHSNIGFVNWLFWAVSWPNRAMGVSESSVAWLFLLEKCFQRCKILPLRPILAHFRCKQQGAVSRGRAVSRFRPPAWSATTADLAQKPPAWSAPRSRPAAFARNRPLSRSRPAAWSATLRGPGTRSSGIPLLFLYYNHNQSTDPGRIHDMHADFHSTSRSCVLRPREVHSEAVSGQFLISRPAPTLRAARMIRSTAFNVYCLVLAGRQMSVLARSVQDKFYLLVDYVHVEYMETLRQHNRSFFPARQRPETAPQCSSREP